MTYNVEPRKEEREREREREKEGKVVERFLLMFSGQQSWGMNHGRSPGEAEREKKKLMWGQYYWYRVEVEEEAAAAVTAF
jgi:hypothetical protein